MYKFKAIISTQTSDLSYDYTLKYLICGPESRIIIEQYIIIISYYCSSRIIELE